MTPAGIPEADWVLVRRICRKRRRRENALLPSDHQQHDEQRHKHPRPEIDIGTAERLTLGFFQNHAPEPFMHHENTRHHALCLLSV